MGMIRLFTAIQLPDDIKEEILALREGIQGAKWTQKSNLHLTLQFIGEVSEQTYHQLRDELEDVQMSTFSLALGPVSRFGEKVLYCSLLESLDLLDLQSMVKEKIENVLPVEKAKYTPHVTLARMKEVDVHELAGYLQKYHDYESREFFVKSFGLYSSKLTASGPVYALENEYDLY